MAAKKSKKKVSLKSFIDGFRRMSPLVVLAFFLTPILLVSMPWVNEYIVANTLLTAPVLDLPQPSAIPYSSEKPVPSTSARSIFIIDRNSKMVLYQKNADLKVYPASTTKMMTALVALDHFNLDQIITVTREYPIGEYVGFQPGERITVEDLLYALLVQSGNDAAEILAENFPGGRSAFVEAMNAKAQAIHLTNTHFLNPSGIDEDGHFSTAIDLARLGDFALRTPEFAKIVATENAVVTSVDFSSAHVLNNVNQLLGRVTGVVGIKTGYTEGAGQSLVTLVDRDNHPVIIVVLGSVDRFGDSQNLIEWVYENFTWRIPTPSI